VIAATLPNFYFHATTVYDILRHCGVELGKRDPGATEIIGAEDCAVVATSRLDRDGHRSRRVVGLQADAAAAAMQ
jgi:hypothetical protein